MANRPNSTRPNMGSLTEHKRHAFRATRVVLAAIFLSTQAIAASQTQLACDDFRKRLTTADTALDFEIPTLKFERAPIHDYDHWWISYSQQGSPISDIEADMSCSADRFQDFEFFDYDVDTPLDAFSHPRTYHLLAAAVYAYTGWQPRQVIKVLSDLLNRAKDEGDPGIVHLPNGALARLWINTKTTGTAHLIIEMDAD
jgi:hypothetical protein